MGTDLRSDVESLCGMFQAGHLSPDEFHARFCLLISVCGCFI